MIANNNIAKAALATEVRALPCTLSQIRACAAKMFADAAVESVNVLAVFGEVNVKRDGSVWIKGGNK